MIHNDSIVRRWFTERYGGDGRHMHARSGSEDVWTDFMPLSRGTSISNENKHDDNDDASEADSNKHDDASEADPNQEEEEPLYWLIYRHTKSQQHCIVFDVLRNIPILYRGTTGLMSFQGPQGSIVTECVDFPDIYAVNIVVPIIDQTIADARAKFHWKCTESLVLPLPQAYHAAIHNELSLPSVIGLIVSEYLLGSAMLWPSVATCIPALPTIFEYDPDFF